MIEEKIGEAFDNIGAKIQKLSKAFFVLDVLASIIGAFAMFIYISSVESEGFFAGLVWGIPILILGSLLSWLLTAPLYGFGKLIENTDILVKNNQTNKNN